MGRGTSLPPIMDEAAPSRSRTKNEIPIVIVRTIFKGVVAKTMELIGYKELGKVLVHAGKIIAS